MNRISELHLGNTVFSYSMDIGGVLFESSNNIKPSEKRIIKYFWSNLRVLFIYENNSPANGQLVNKAFSLNNENRNQFNKSEPDFNC